jgi:hypothetical protein
MLKSLIGGVAAALVLAGPALASGVVEMRNVTARVTVIPEARDNVQVTVLKANPRLPLRVRRGLDGAVVIDGDAGGGDWFRMWLGGRITHCPSDGDRPTVSVVGVGEIGFDDLPQIVIRTPMQARVRTRGAIVGAVGRSDALDLSIGGCDRWTIANVRNNLKIDEAGSGRVRAGSAGALTVRIAGSGDVAATEIANGLTVEIAGSGNVSAASASGPIKLEVAGDGDISLGGGHASELTVKIAGAGDVDYRGVADAMDASIAGSGDVYAAKVTGSVTKSIIGSGRIEAGR